MANERIRREPGSGDANYSTSTSDARRAAMDWSQLTESEMAELDAPSIEQRFRALDHTDPEEEARLSALLQGGEAWEHDQTGGWFVVVRGEFTVPILRQDQLNRLVAAAKEHLGPGWSIGPHPESGWLFESMTYGTDDERGESPSGALGLAWYRSKQNA